MSDNRQTVRERFDAKVVLVVGADVSTARLALADTEGGSRSLMLGNGRDGAQLADTFHRAGIMARQFAGDRPIVAVFIEIPTGKYPSPFLMQTTGAIAAGIYAGLDGTQAHPVSVWPIAVTQWKKHALGVHNAGKEQIMAWAVQHGAPANQDEADALGIAHGGARWYASHGGGASA